MDTTQSTIEAINRTAADVGAVAKTDRNTSQNFQFRGIDAVVNACAPAMRRYGLVVVPHVDHVARTDVEVGRNRTKMAHVDVTVTYRFCTAADPTGVEVTVVGEAMDAGDKAVSKAMSVAYRICLLQTFTLPTNEPDPDSDSYSRSEAPHENPAPNTHWANTNSVDGNTDTKGATITAKRRIEAAIHGIGVTGDDVKTLGRWLWQDIAGWKPTYAPSDDEVEQVLSSLPQDAIEAEQLIETLEVPA